MGNNVEKFNHEVFGAVDVFIIEGVPHFYGKGIAELLGYSNPNKAVRDHVDAEDKVYGNIKTKGGSQKVIFLSKEGVYALCSRSRMDVDRESVLSKLGILQGYDIIVVKRRPEHVALCTIEQVLGVELQRQFHVEGFFIDGYDKKNNIAYEVEEKHHKYQTEEDKEREIKIKEKLQCSFVRVWV